MCFRRRQVDERADTRELRRGEARAADELEHLEASPARGVRDDVTGVGIAVERDVRQVSTPVPKDDDYGNEIAGVRSVLLQTPLGTYTS
jgi:hypothetical protein